MTDEPFYSPTAKPRPARTPQPGEPVWTLTKGAQRLACVLRDDGAVGCEAQLLRDGAFYKGRRFATRAQALAHSARVRLRLEREGWTIGADVTG